MREIRTYGLPAVLRKRSQRAPRLRTTNAKPERPAPDPELAALRERIKTIRQPTAELAAEQRKIAELIRGTSDRSA